MGTLGGGEEIDVRPSQRVAQRWVEGRRTFIMRRRSDVAGGV